MLEFLCCEEKRDGPLIQKVYQERPKYKEVTQDERNY